MISNVLRWAAGLATVAILSGCGVNTNLGPKKDLGEFSLGHNVVVADNAQSVPLSREVDLDEMEKMMTDEVERRLGRYDGRQLYHVGVTVAGYFIAPPGVPVVASPKSVMILMVNVWDDAAQKKLTAEPQQITVFESVGVGTLTGSGYLKNSEQQVQELAQNAVAGIEDFLEENPQWFAAKPGLEDELRNVVTEEAGGAEAAADAVATASPSVSPQEAEPAESSDKPKPRPLPL